jgi:hypothetical protein
MAAHEQVLDIAVTVPPGTAPGTPAAMHFSEPFEIKKHGNVRVDLSSPVRNSWLGVQGDLVNEETSEVVSFYDEISYYYGSDSDGSWSEGGTSSTEYLSSVEPGRYVLRTTAVYESASNVIPQQYEVKLTSGTPRGSWFCCALVMLLLGPALGWLRSSSFESTRWAESNLASSSD